MSTSSITFRADTNAVYQALQRLRRAGVEPQSLLRRFMETHVRKIPQRAVQEQRSPAGLRPWKPLTHGLRAGKPALKDTGALVKAFLHGRVTATSSSATLEPRPNLRRFWIHQTGGTIRPVRAKMLAIPISKEARKAGSARKWWSQAQSAGKRPFIHTSSNGKKMIAYSRDGNLVPVFLLKDSVKIPKRPFIGFGARDRQKFVDMTREYLRSAVRRSGRA